MNRPKVTVVITVRNGIETIKACVESVLRNKYPKEIIVIDAFSDDGTYEVLKKIKGIKLLRLEGNAPKAFNHGIKIAKHPVVVLTDADCVVEKFELVPVSATPIDTIFLKKFTDLLNKTSFKEMKERYRIIVRRLKLKNK